MQVFNIPEPNRDKRKKILILEAENERLKKELEETKKREMMFAKTCAVLLLHYTE